MIGIVSGMGKPEVARLNFVFYYLLGTPLGLVLTFVFNVRESGVWIGLAVALLMVNTRYANLALRSDYKKVARSVQERNKGKPE